MRVTPVVITLGPSERLERCLASVRSLGLGGSPICVVNQARPHPAMEQSDGVRWIYPGMNLGWAGAAHLARQQMKDADAIWFVQDDMEVNRQALGLLEERLDGDDKMAAVRPCVVGETGIVNTGACGALLDRNGQPETFIPPAPSEPGAIDAPARLDYLPSSGLMITADAWDAKGGFNPWFYPVGCIDQDLGLALSRSGRGLVLATEAVVIHTGKASTPSALGHFCEQRHRALLANLWFDAPVNDEPGALVAPSIVAAARAYRHAPEEASLTRLREIAGAAAADSYIRFARWQSIGFDAILSDYQAVSEARDWWRAQHDRAAEQLRASNTADADEGPRAHRRWPWRRKN